MLDSLNKTDTKYTCLGTYLMLLHQVENAADRWAPLIEKGADDDEILARIGDELGIYGGQSMDEHYFVDGKGGSSPQIKVSQMGKPWRDVVTLKGSQLVELVRFLLKIPPKGQMTLF